MICTDTTDHTLYICHWSVLCIWYEMLFFVFAFFENGVLSQFHEQFIFNCFSIINEISLVDQWRHIWLLPFYMYIIRMLLYCMHINKRTIQNSLCLPSFSPFFSKSKYLYMPGLDKILGMNNFSFSLNFEPLRRQASRGTEAENRRNNTGQRRSHEAYSHLVERTF